MLKLPGIDRRTLTADVIAGTTTALVSLPKVMGYALIAGVNPVYGLYTAIVATMVGALTTGSSYLTVAATNAVSVTVFSALKVVPPADAVAALFVLTLLVGLFQLTFGLMKLGSLSRFISQEVLVGFVTGAALLIILGQLKNLTGYQSSNSGSEMRQALDLLLHLRQVHVHTLVVGVATLALIMALQQTRWKNTALIASLALISALTMWTGWDIKLVRDVGRIPNSLPMPIIPDIRLAPGLIVPALAIAVLGLVESVGITQNTPEPDGAFSDLNEDFKGQGMANIVGSFFRCMPSSGSLTATAVNLSAGAQTRLSNLCEGVVTGSIVVLLAGYVELIPMPAMAGLLIFIGIHLIKVKEIAKIWKTSPIGRGAMAVTFISTQALPLEYSIYVGVVGSALLYMYFSSLSIRVVELVRTPEGHYATQPAPATIPGGLTTVLAIDGSLHYASAYTLEQHLPCTTTSGLAAVVLVLRLHEQCQLDTTLVHMLERYAKRLTKAGGRLFLSGISEDFRERLSSTEAIDIIGRENIHCATPVLGEALEHAVKAAEDWLAEAKRMPSTK